MNSRETLIERWKRTRPKAHTLYKLSVAELRIIEDELGMEPEQGAYFVYLNKAEQEKARELGFIRAAGRIEDEETRRLRRQVITEEINHALSNPPEKDELKALYRAYYQDWSKEDLHKQLTQMDRYG